MLNCEHDPMQTRQGEHNTAFGSAGGLAPAPTRRLPVCRCVRCRHMKASTCVVCGWVGGRAGGVGLVGDGWEWWGLGVGVVVGVQVQQRSYTTVLLL